MNIFATNADPVVCAEALDDKRLVKMVLETAQILCTAARRSGFNHPTLYRSTHEHHPCVVWAYDPQNYHWLIRHFEALGNEYSHRYGRSHKSIIQLLALLRGAVMRPRILQEPRSWPNVSGVEGNNLFECYQECLIRKWYADPTRPKWTNRGAPSWRR